MTENVRPSSSHEPDQQPSEPASGQPPAAVEDVKPAAEDAKPAATEDAKPTGSSPPNRGEVRYQDPATAKPRPPTLDERLARQRAEEEERARELAERNEAERKSRIRRRIMIGGGVGVGLVALVAAGYAVASPPQVTANCVSDQNAVVTSEVNCDEAYVNSHGGHFSGAIFFLAGRSYRYYYGGSGHVGQVATGGSFEKPSNATIKTPSGKTIQRGGFGIHGGSGGS